MKRLLLVIYGMTISFWVSAQSPLPPCPKDPNSLKHRCYGSYLGSDGSGYVGEWENLRWHGKGVFTTASGYKYEGDYRDGRKHGFGTESAKDGKYIGNFKIDERDGKGTFTYPNGDRYIGDFKGGKFNGLGVFKTLDGFTYSGEFRDNNYHGKGIAVTSDGRRFEGIWETNKLVREAKINLGNIASDKDDKVSGTRENSASSTQSSRQEPSIINQAAQNSEASRVPNLSEEFLREDNRRYESAVNAAALRDRERKGEFERNIAATSAHVRKFCVRKNLNIRQLSEYVGKQSRSNPNSVEYRSIQVLENPLFGATCVAQFYHSNGVCNLPLRFDDNGDVYPGQCR